MKFGEDGMLGGEVVNVYKDGPFPWDAEDEGLINAIISAGMMVGTLMTLFVYDHIDGNLVFAISLGFPGFINILTPTFAVYGGHLSVSVFRFFTGLYSYPNPSKHLVYSYGMNIILFLGI